MSIEMQGKCRRIIACLLARDHTFRPRTPYSMHYCATSVSFLENFFAVLKTQDVLDIISEAQNPSGFKTSVK